ncbi:MAG: hypothetical protein AB8B51_18755 [Sedimentitalea sp.]
MTVLELERTAENLEATLISAGPEARLSLQPKFSDILQKLSASGQRVPRRLRDLDELLLDEAVEARFDNMPV